MVFELLQWQHTSWTTCSSATRIGQTHHLRRYNNLHLTSLHRRDYKPCLLLCYLIDLKCTLLILAITSWKTLRLFLGGHVSKLSFTLSLLFNHHTCYISCRIRYKVPKRKVYVWLAPFFFSYQNWCISIMCSISINFLRMYEFANFTD